MQSAPGPRRRGHEAYAGRLAGPVCVYMCVPVHDAVRSRSPVTSESQATPALERRSADLVPGWRVPAVLSGKMGWGGELSTSFVEALGPRPGQGG